MLVDLHMHSTCSDGKYTPEELVTTCVAKGMGVMAVTDHDAVAGVVRAQAQAAKLGNVIRVLPGVEMSTEYDDNSVHILGYHLDVTNEALLAMLEQRRAQRKQRAQKMIDKLCALGYPIEMDLNAPGNEAVGRPHLAKKLIAAGYFPTVGACFEALLKKGAPAYVKQPFLSPEAAVELIHGAGGIAVLAHPSELRDSSIPEKLFQACAFDGIEIWHPSAETPELIEKWLGLAHKYHLLTSGGSDFHGIKGNRYPEALGLWQVKYEDVQGVINWK